jgi:SAM-dependent methyltransferase
MPTEAALESFYGTYYEAEQVGADKGKFTFGDPHRMAAHLARWLKPAAAGSVVRVLDFGGGDGTLSMLAAEEAVRLGRVQGAEVVVVDHNAPVPESSKGAVTRSVCRDLASLPLQQFDLVIASAVMEHIVAPRPVLTALVSKVKPGGYFYARTPYVTPFMRLLERFGRRWDLTFPAHVHDLGQAFWEGQFGETGHYSEFATVHSRPSIVEASFRTDTIKAMLSLAFKLPWFVLRHHWGFVGGWEIVARRA